MRCNNQTREPGLCDTSFREFADQTVRSSLTLYRSTDRVPDTTNSIFREVAAARWRRTS